MTPFKPFKKSGGFKKPFKKGSFGGFGKGDQKEMHAATCADCGKACEVPFRPTGERPVYCRDCFSNNMPSRDSNNAPRRDFGESSRKPFRPSHDGGFRQGGSVPQAVPVNSPEMGKLARQIEMLNASIEKLSNILEASMAAAPVPVEKLRRKKKAA